MEKTNNKGKIIGTVIALIVCVLAFLALSATYVVHQKEYIAVRRFGKIISLAKELDTKYDGIVPDTYDELVSLPGVGRKTANVVLAEGFGQQQIAVDTHVFRLANRIGLTAEKDVLKTELGLQKAIPNDRWTLTHHLLIIHGRRCCSARSPQCQSCPINDICEKNGL